MWHRGADDDEVVQFTPERKDFDKPFPAKALAQEMQEVNEGKVDWREVCFVQLCSVSQEALGTILKVAPDIPLLGGAGASSRSLGDAVHPEADEITPPKAQDKLDIVVWPPPRKRDAAKPNFAPSRKHDEGIITHTPPNKKCIYS